MRGFVHLFREIGDAQHQVPLFLIDEAERFGLVTNTDTYWSWIAALRELTEIIGLSLIFFVGAKTQDDIPQHLWVDEIRTRIGVVNYIELWNPDREALKDFLLDLFSTMLSKGPVPEEQREAVADFGVDPAVTEVPLQLQERLPGTDQALASFPFTPDALDAFVATCAETELSDKPREVLIRLQKAAQKSFRQTKPLIDLALVEEVSREPLV